MQIFLGQPLNVAPQVKIEKKVVMNQQYYVIKGQNFTYYVKTKNGIVSEVIAKAPYKLAPVSYFIQNPQNCVKKLIMRVPLRMAKYEYDCNGTVYHYTTFGVPGNLITSVSLK